MLTVEVNTASSGGDGSTGGTTGPSAAYANYRSALLGSTFNLASEPTESVTIRGYTFTDVALLIRCNNAGGVDTNTNTSGSGVSTGDYAGSGMSDTRRILTIADDGSWMTDLVSGSGYRIAGACGNFNNGLYIAGDYGAWAFAGMEFFQTGSGTRAGFSTLSSGTGELAVKPEFFACLIGTAGTRGAIRGCNNTRFVMSRFDAANADPVEVQGSDNHVDFVHCLATQGGANGFESDTIRDGSQVWRGNVGFGNGTADYSGGTTFEDAAYNASGDSSAFGSNPVTNITTAAFVDSANNDYKPAPAGVLVGVAPDAVTLGYARSRVDANGNPRPNGNTWAIGPFEPAASGTVVAATGDQVNISDGVATGSVVVPSRTIQLTGNNRLADVDGNFLTQTGWIAEWYDKTTDTTGDPVDSFTFDSIAGVASATLTNSTMADGVEGTLLVKDPVNGKIRGIYELPVTVT